MDISEAIRLKRAVRNFTSEPLPREVTLAILNAGRRAQSSKNTQPWHFIAIQDRQILEEIAKCGTWAGHLSEAALGVAILTPEPSIKYSILIDAGQAVAYMQLAAWGLGVGSCLASIYEPEQARQILGFPEELHLCIALSFGYPVSDEIMTAKPRLGGRRKIDEIVHWDRW